MIGLAQFFGWLLVLAVIFVGVAAFIGHMLSAAEEPGE